MITTSFDQTFEQRLRAEIQKSLDRVTENVMNGVRPEFYQSLIGAASAYREILNMCDDIRKAMLHE